MNLLHFPMFGPFANHTSLPCSATFLQKMLILDTYLKYLVACLALGSWSLPVVSWYFKPITCSLRKTGYPCKKARQDDSIREYLLLKPEPLTAPVQKNPTHHSPLASSSLGDLWQRCWTLNLQGLWSIKPWKHNIGAPSHVSKRSMCQPDAAWSQEQD